MAKSREDLDSMGLTILRLWVARCPQHVRTLLNAGTLYDKTQAVTDLVQKTEARYRQTGMPSLSARVKAMRKYAIPNEFQTKRRRHLGPGPGRWLRWRLERDRLRRELGLEKHASLEPKVPSDETPQPDSPPDTRT